MNMDRRSFLKFLGKSGALISMAAAAPKTAFGMLANGEVVKEEKTTRDEGLSPEFLKQYADTFGDLLKQKGPLLESRKFYYTEWTDKEQLTDKELADTRHALQESIKRSGAQGIQNMVYHRNYNRGWAAYSHTWEADILCPEGP